MMRKCHLNTCPVGIATQDPELRKKFEGKPEHVINYFFMLAEEVRVWMSKLGVRTIQELVGRTDFLKPKETKHPKAKFLEFGGLLKNALSMRPGVNIVGGSVQQDFELEKRLDNQLIAKAQPILKGTQTRIDIEMDIVNSARAFATTLSYHIAKYEF
jgi:glutamate synthase (NADPH/NADH)